MPEETRLTRIVGVIRRKLEEADKAREDALGLHRCSIRESSLAIRATHRGDFESARLHLESVKRTLNREAPDYRH